jgi:hypothetical protein
MEIVEDNQTNEIFVHLVISEKVGLSKTKQKYRTIKSSPKADEYEKLAEILLVN